MFAGIPVELRDLTLCSGGICNRWKLDPSDVDRFHGKDDEFNTYNWVHQKEASLWKRRIPFNRSLTFDPMRMGATTGKLQTSGS